MLLNLPCPYEDELLYSTFARMFAYTKPIGQERANLALFGNRNAFSVGFGFRLNRIAEQTRTTWDLSSDDLVSKMTLLPFYGYYLPFGRYSKCSDSLKTGDGRRLLKSLGLVGGPNVSLGTHPRFCRSCTMMDLANHGETYWRRAHQLAGTLICTTHNEVLRLSKAKMFPDSRSISRFQDATEHIDIESSSVCADLDPHEFGLASRISVRSLEFLYGFETPWTSFNPRDLYRRAALVSQHRKGRSTGRVDGKIIKDLVDYFGRSFLTKIGCDLDPNQKSLMSIFQVTSSRCSHPVLHVLVQIFLEHRIGSPLGIYDDGPRGIYERSDALLEKQWKCPNPFAKHPATFRTPAARPRQAKDGKIYRSLKCKCGYGFSFTSPTIDDPLMPVVAKAFAYGPAFEARAKLLKLGGSSASQIALSMKIHRSVAERLISGAKNRSELSREPISSKAWLLKQPKIRKPRRGGRIFDWDTYDATHAPLLAPAADALRSERPMRRISIRSLVDQTGIQALRSNLLRLPLCEKVVSEVIEPAVGWKTERLRCERLLVDCRSLGSDAGLMNATSAPLSEKQGKFDLPNNN
jgi:hypothetical protein